MPESSQPPDRTASPSRSTHLPPPPPHTCASTRGRARTKSPQPRHTDPGAVQSQSSPYSCLLPLTLPFRAGPRVSKSPASPIYTPLSSPLPLASSPFVFLQLSLSLSPGGAAGTPEPRLPGVPVSGQARVVPARAAAAGHLGEGVAR